MEDLYEGKRTLVTGKSGTDGIALVRQDFPLMFDELRLNAIESALSSLRKNMQGDRLEGTDTIIHSAAPKPVMLFVYERSAIFNHVFLFFDLKRSRFLCRGVY